MSEEIMDVELTDKLFKELFPICRSITGEGVRETLRILSKEVSFNIKEVPSGTECYDWCVPQEWNIKDAWIKDSRGNKIVDFKVSNLHVLNYSQPIDKKVEYSELVEHVHTLPEMPNAIPYRTSYYKKAWGFCMSHKEFLSLNKEETYHVFIDSTLTDGSLTYGEAILEGKSENEILISTYCCHPSLANDNLSGPILWTLLLKYLKTQELNFTYRFIIIPETIGAIAYLKENEEAMKNVKGGYVITTTAGPGKFGYKNSFLTDSEFDKAAKLSFFENSSEYIDYPFDIYGSDESHFSAPAFRIPVGTICKDKYYEYDYYHTSLDNLDFVKSEYLVETLKIYKNALNIIDNNFSYLSTIPQCEPMLSKRGLYPSLGGSVNQRKSAMYKADKISEEDTKAISWLMFYGDGEHTLIDVSEKTNIKTDVLIKNIKLLFKEGMIKKSYE